MIIPLDPNRPLINKDGTAASAFKAFMLQVTEESLVIGNGAPDGILEAGQGRLYMDEDGTTGTILYIKQYADIGGDRSLGWILV